MLVVSDLSAGYGEANILHNVSMRIRTNEVAAILGANGSGKSTLLKAIAGVVRARTGGITLNDKPIQHLPPHRIASLGLSYVPQIGNTFPSLTVDENLQMASEAAGLGGTKPDDVYRIFPLLLESRKRRAALLSGGGRQMLGIGMGLVGQRAILLLDEPTAALSPLMAQLILDAIVHKIVPMGVTVLLVEQRVREALSISSRAYVMVDGQVAREADAGKISEQEIVTLLLGGSSK